MLVVTYDNKDHVTEINYDCQGVQVFERPDGLFNVQWDSGSLGGVTNLLVLDDGTNIAVGDDVTLFLPHDKKDEHKKVKVEDKLAEIDVQQASQDEMLVFLFELQSGGAL